MFMSGQTQDVLLKEGIERGAAFLQKSFLPAVLAQRVREAFNSDNRADG
jgi:hypothetical protein